MRKCCPSWIMLLLAAVAFTFGSTALTACGEDPAEEDQDTTAEEDDGDEGATDPNGPKLYAIALHEDTCPACKEMGPVWMSLAQDLPEDVKPLMFDWTSDESNAESKSLAEQHGIKEIAEARSSEMGYVLLLNAADNSEVGRVTADMDAEAMKQAVHEALDQVGS